MVLERTIHADTLAAISEPDGFFPIVLFHVAWPGDPLHAHTNRGDLIWAEETWRGIGNIAGVSLPGEALGMASQDAALSVLGFGDDLDAYLSTDARDVAAKIWFGVVSEQDGATLIGEPFEIFTGSVDGMRDVVEATSDGVTRGVSLPLSSGPSQRAMAGVFHSFEDQARSFPGDTAGRLLINSEREALRHRWPE